MKTQNQNKLSALKSIFAVLLILLGSVSTSFATNGNDNKKNKEKVTSKVDSVAATELLEDVFEIEELDFATEIQESAFQVIDSNDQLIFSGSVKEWEDQKNRNVVIMKRKAEFLFESNGTQIYKVF